jgi:DNA segregation ATPase FtsK/SpoIIIE, S-DNA-T family
MNQAPPSSAPISLPWLFDRTIDKHLCLLGGGDTRAETQFLASLAASCLKTYPSPAAQFLFIDVAGVGQNFSAFGELRESSPDVIGGGIVTAQGNLRESLRAVRAAMGNIFTTKLVGPHNHIDDYNRARLAETGASGEPYRFIFITDFPYQFDAESCVIMNEIVERGATCGIHLFLNFDQTREIPYGVKVDGIVSGCTRISLRGAGRADCSRFGPGSSVSARPFSALDKGALVQAVGTFSAQARAMQTRKYDFETMMKAIYASREGRLVPFTCRWSASSAAGVEIPLGLGAGGKVEANSLGQGGADGRHHMLVLGASGTGKSNLLHVAIQGMAELYNPDELSLYLVDSKSGTEFRRYDGHGLPHAEAIALRRTSEYALSILEGLLVEGDRRSTAFGNYGGSIESYRNATGRKLPRIVAIFDEFQELLTSGDRAADSKAADLLEKIARLGRSAGIHLILATQSLGGLTLPPGLLEQVALRICLSPVGLSRHVLSDGNNGSEGLRKFYALNNTERGYEAGNSVFQVAASTGADAQSPEGIAEAANRIRHLASEWAKMPDRTRTGPRYVFDGEKPAKMEDSAIFKRLVTETWNADPRAPVKLMVGEPIKIADTHFIDLARKADNNALFLARAVEDVAGSLLLTLVSALASKGPGNVRLHVLDATMTPDSDLAVRLDVLQRLWPDVILVERDVAIVAEHMIAELQQLVAHRQAGTAADETHILAILGMQEVPYLMDEGFVLNELMRRGPSQGVHVVAWCDTERNLSSILGSEHNFGFGLCSPSMAEQLCRSQLKASKAATNRLLAYNRDQLETGELEAVRPFALPDLEKLHHVINRIRNRSSSDVNPGQ